MLFLSYDGRVRRKIFVLPLFSLIAFLLIFLFVTNVYAADCDRITAISVNPESGDTKTLFTFTGYVENCADKAGTTLALVSKNPNDPTKPSFSYRLSTNSSGIFSLQNAVFPDVGTWDIKVGYQLREVKLDNPLKITIGQGAALKCGDTVSPHADNCPADCQASLVSDDLWICGGAPTPTPVPPTPTRILSAPIISPCPTGVGGDCINTAIGLIPTKPAGLVSRLFSLLLGLSGGIALILIMISGYRLMTSGANAEAVTGAKETLTSAIVGLLFIIFSLVILEVVGVDILKIPGLNP